MLELFRHHEQLFTLSERCRKLLNKALLIKWKISEAIREKLLHLNFYSYWLSGSRFVSTNVSSVETQNHN